MWTIDKLWPRIPNPQALQMLIHSFRSIVWFEHTMHTDRVALKKDVPKNWQDWAYSQN